jgi:hypothetical protein
MIISHKYKFIFTAIPKTATHAIRFALRPHLGEEDLEQVGLFIKKAFPFKETAGIPHGHIKCKEIKPLLTPEIWDNYFKFAIVRNPYDRFVSYCAFTNLNNPDFVKNPQSYMYRALLDKKTHKSLWFIPQHEYITNEEGELIVDYVGRQEELENSYQHVCEKLNIPFQQLDKINASSHKPYQEYFNDELTEMVYEYYKTDFINFNYNKNL